MGRGRSTTLDDLAGLPWPVPLALGAAAYVGIRHGLPAWLSGRGPVFDGLAQRPDTFAPFAWLVLAACTLAALVSFLRARQRRRLLDTRADLDSIAALGWRDFERLVGEAFRRQRYRVEETGLGGADGGIDLILSRGGRRTLVQCKQWRRRQVPVNVVREMYGLLAHHGAHAVRIAALGGFTRDAARFAAGKPIELIDGPALLALIRSVQTGQGETQPAASPVPPQAEARVEPVLHAPGASDTTTPDCPRCGGPMVERTNSTTAARFWGCPRYPACRGTR